MGPSLVGISGSNLTGCVDVCVLCGVSLCVWIRILMNEANLARFGLLNQKEVLYQQAYSSPDMQTTCTTHRKTATKRSGQPITRINSRTLLVSFTLSACLLPSTSLLYINPCFRSLGFHLGRLDPWRWDGHVVPKRRCKTNLRCVTSLKTTEFNSRTFTH
jgi:hypothetical protein